MYLRYDDAAAETSARGATYAETEVTKRWRSSDSLDGRSALSTTYSMHPRSTSSSSDPSASNPSNEQLRHSAWFSA